MNVDLSGSGGVDLQCVMALSEYSTHATDCAECKWPDAEVPLPETSCKLGAAYLNHVYTILDRQEFEEAAKTMHQVGATLDTLQGEGFENQPRP